jgi:hypothetical protein
MPQTVQCPSCAGTLALDPQDLGTTVLCPLCQGPFVAGPPPEGEPPPGPEPLPEPPRTPGLAFTRGAGIDVGEAHDPAVGSLAEAEGRLLLWKEALPEVESAYRPSGRLPGAAVLALTAGMALGAVAGAAVLFVLAGVTTALLFGLVWLLRSLGRVRGKLLLLGVLLALAVGLGGYGLAFAALGWVAAVTTTGLGRFGKNRHAPAALFASAGSAVLALALVNLGVEWVADRLGRNKNPAGGDGWVGWVALAVEVVGSLLAVAVAGYTGRKMVRSSKFCEGCERYLEGKELPGLGLGRLKALALALREGELEAAGEYLGGPAGEGGKPVLFRCPGCGRGYLEVTARFRAVWQEKDEAKEKTASWLAASAELDEGEMEHFGSHFPGE